MPEASGVVNFLYCFNGSISINSKEEILKGDSVIFEEWVIAISALEQSDLVLFQIKADGVYCETGMYSGNKYRPVKQFPVHEVIAGCSILMSKAYSVVFIFVM